MFCIHEHKQFESLVIFGSPAYIYMCVFVCRLGSIIGAGVCISALCADSRIDSKVYVKTSKQRFSQALHTCDPKHSDYQVIIF